MEVAIMNSLKYWLGAVLHGWLVIEGLAVLAFVASLPAFIAVFFAALITGLVLDEVANRARFDNQKYWLRAFAVSVFITAVWQVFGLLNVALLPGLQYAVIAAIAYFLWDGLVGQIFKATEEDALRVAHA